MVEGRPRDSRFCTPCGVEVLTGDGVALWAGTDDSLCGETAPEPSSTAQVSWRSVS